MENKKTTYSVSIKFAKEEDGNLILDKNKEIKYENLVDKERLLRLAKFLETQIKMPKDHPIAYFSLKSNLISEDEYDNLPCGGPSRPILEFTTTNGETNKETIYELEEGHFVRRLYLCDIIKNWDFEEF